MRQKNPFRMVFTNTILLYNFYTTDKMINFVDLKEIASNARTSDHLEAAEIHYSTILWLQNPAHRWCFRDQAYLSLWDSIFGSTSRTKPNPISLSNVPEVNVFFVCFSTSPMAFSTTVTEMSCCHSMKIWKSKKIKTHQIKSHWLARSDPDYGPLISNFTGILQSTFITWCSKFTWISACSIEIQSRFAVFRYYK